MEAGSWHIQYPHPKHIIVTAYISQSMLFWSVLPQFFVPAACGPACVPIGSSGSEIAVDVVADGFQFLLRVPPQHNAFASLSEKAKNLAKAGSP